MFALEDPSPNRIGFDLERVMRTDYRIDDFQQVYFVIPSIEALNDATLEDFGPIYDRLKGAVGDRHRGHPALRPGHHPWVPGLCAQGRTVRGMKRLRAIVVLTGLVAVAACTDSKQAAREATWGDQPADIACWSYGEPVFSGRSTGKVEYDEGGRVSFVDAASGRYTTVDGDCRVVYLREGEDAKSAPPAAVSSSPQGATPTT